MAGIFEIHFFFWQHRVSVSIDPKLCFYPCAEGLKNEQKKALR